MKSFLKKNKIHVMSSFIMLSFVSYYSFPKKNNEISKILKDDISSKTVMSVSKKISKHWDNEKINVYENEKKWLKILENTDIIAKPIQFDDENRIITTEYVGEKINKKNLPKDWEKQRDIIIKTLKDNNCSHNDIKPDELIVYENKIKLIDFGWAHELDKNIPKYWPKGLGAEFKCNSNNKEFDDKCSFNKSINFIKK